MNELPIELFKKWKHSFEEDEGDIMVYRPSEFNFPRARGRAGIEFLESGGFIDWAIGRGDAEATKRGQWTAEKDGKLKVSFAQGRVGDRTIEVVECSKMILRMRIMTHL